MAPAAALFIRKTAPVASARPEVIAAAFKLTPTELRVLLAIVELGSVPEVAAALGVAGTTVRWHVGRLFEKTGARLQADLVKLVTGYDATVTQPGVHTFAIPYSPFAIPTPLTAFRTVTALRVTEMPHRIELR